MTQGQGTIDVCLAEASSEYQEEYALPMDSARTV